MEETDNEDGDSIDDSSDDSVEILDKFPPPRKTRVKMVFLRKKVVEARLAREDSKNKHLEDASID
ncbi:hypothetical protein GBA52_023502 [Prunus armeniaca]|nr:hypothetical protein GBA52_023502 [Prunus armeniaca]